MMNKEQKEKLQNIKDILKDISEELEALGDEEQEKFDNLNEGMQAMAKFQKLEENAEGFYCAQESIEECINTLDEFEE